jgi:MFS family permease
VRIPGVHSNLSLYYAARFSGQLAHNLFLATLLVIAGTGGHTAAGLGSLMAATTIAAVVFGIPGGALADRLGPGRGFALGASLRCLFIALALLGFSGHGSIIVIAFLYAAVSQVHNPSEMALVKVLCASSAGRVHSLLVALQYGGQGLGFLVLAPVLYLWGGVQAALAGSLALMLLHMLATSVLALRIRTSDREDALLRRGPFAGMRETLSVFSHSEPARDALAVLAVKSLVGQVILLAFPLYVRHDLSLGTGGAVVLLAPGVAGVAAGILWGATFLKLDGAIRAMRLSILGLAIAVFALAALDYGVTFAFAASQVQALVRFEAALNMTAVVAMPVAFLVGASLSVALVSSRVALTAAAPLGIQSRVFAVQATVSDALVVVPVLFAGVAAEFLGARMTLGALGLLCGGTWLVMWHPWFQLPALARRRLAAEAARAA